MKKIITSFFILSVLFLTNCSSNKNNTIWIYTSLYPNVVEKFDAALKEKFPDIKVQWFQSGSEKVIARVGTELVAGDVKANLVCVSDFFWYEKMAGQGFWTPYATKTSYEIPAAFKSPKDDYNTVRLSTMVIAYNKKFVSEADAPKSFTELTDPKWKSKVSSGSPLESGTNYGLMNNLAFRYGYDFIQKLRDNDVMASGGNSNTVTRLLSGERPVGMLLLENALVENKKNPDVGIIYPSDGSIVIPAPLAITKATKNVEAAQKVYDFFMSDEGQKLIVADGNMHSFDPKAGAPTGAAPLNEILSGGFTFSDEFKNFVIKEEPSFKEKFSGIMLQ